MRILVADDAPDVIESVRLGFTLQWREVEVLGAAVGEQALDLVEKERPDLVLLDIGLPDIDGYEVLRQIRAFSDVPVVMLTARDDTLDLVKALERLRSQAVQPPRASGARQGRAAAPGHAGSGSPRAIISVR